MKPEIKNDEFYYDLVELIKKRKPLNILEIGSSTGEGSTQAFIEGAESLKKKPIIFCVESIKDRYDRLVENTSMYSYVRHFNYSSVKIEDFMTEKKVVDFYRTHQKFNIAKYPIQEILKWRNEDIENIIENKIPQDIIKKIKHYYEIENYDFVLIDGSAFTGDAEFENIYGAKIIALDDIHDIKNWDNYIKLLDDDSYTLYKSNISLRNGYAIFEKHPSHKS